MSLEDEIRAEVRDLLREQLDVVLRTERDSDGDIRIEVKLRIRGEEFASYSDTIPADWIYTAGL